MLTEPAEMLRRAIGRATGRLHSLPILALTAHTACNCRCVMCDIWKANAARREIDLETLRGHTAAMRRLRVRRVMLTGGEPLLHRNLWALCEVLRAEGIRVSLVTTGLLIARHAPEIARHCDEVVVSVDGHPSVHDAIRGVRGAHAVVAGALHALAKEPGERRVIARTVVQHLNCGSIDETIATTARLPVDRLSFLAADLSTSAFNRPVPWSEDRRAQVALDAQDVTLFGDAIARASAQHRALFARGFIAGGERSLWRIHQRARAELGDAPLPAVRCNAPWVSAVLEADGRLRPCFFQPAYATRSPSSLDAHLNSPEAIAFRNELHVGTNRICQRCVCALSLPPHREV